MTAEFLISEGRRLARPCIFLRPTGSGPVAAIWHDRDDAEISRTGYHCWITVDLQFVPNLPREMSGFMSVFTDENKFPGSKVELHTGTHNRPGTMLFASEESVLPPIEVVFSRGSDAIGDWLAANDWPREERYNDNFHDSKIVDAYQRAWFKEYPIYRQDDTYAVLGGWHLPCADDDWYELIDEKLLLLTIRDSEPWIEAWHLKNGKFRVIQRIT